MPEIGQSLLHYSIVEKIGKGGTGNAEQLMSVPNQNNYPFSISADGKTLFVLYRKAANYDIAAMPMNGDRQWKPLLNESHNEVYPTISPDGRWLAQTSNESGQYEIYVRPFPALDSGKWQVSTNGGDEPLWSQDGRELFYRGIGSNAGAVLAVTVETEPAFNPNAPRILFRGDYVLEASVNWDISPDGKRFLLIKESGSGASASEGSPKINIVLNWLEELKQRVPPKIAARPFGHP